MKEIIFRGKCKYNGQWIYGSLLSVGEARYIYHHNYIDLDDIDVGRGFEEVIPETVGQYTGLKDKNRISIYEGDILQTELFKKINTIHIVEWIEKEARFTDYDPKEEFEVIGNIYDNPELLEGEINMNYKIEKEGTYKGFDYFVIALEGGYRCGYVTIEKNHKLYEKDYDSVNFNVHGGLIFSNFSPVDKKDRWLLGFDCAHFGDAKDESIMNPFYLKIYKEYKQLIEMNKETGLDLVRDHMNCNELFKDTTETIRTTEYVENECQKLIDQILKDK